MESRRIARRFGCAVVSFLLLLFVPTLNAQQDAAPVSGAGVSGTATYLPPPSAPPATGTSSSLDSRVAYNGTRDTGSNPGSVSAAPGGAAVIGDPASSRETRPRDRNRAIYYKNKLEVSLEGGALPYNTPFLFDCFSGSCARRNPLHYTLVPFLLSLRWHASNIAGPSVLRGNWEISFSGSYTMIPRGTESRYFAYVTGIRRNFVQPNSRVVPYVEGRLGVGSINAHPPQGVAHPTCWTSPALRFCGQGQDLDFTIGLETGARVQVNPRVAFVAGLEYMHISNLYLSEPHYENLGINNVGPALGIVIALHPYRQPPGE